MLGGIYDFFFLVLVEMLGILLLVGGFLFLVIMFFDVVNFLKGYLEV